MCAQLLSCVWLFCNPMDCSPPRSSVDEIFQVRILEWVAISFSRSIYFKRMIQFIFFWFSLNKQILRWNIFLNVLLRTLCQQWPIPQSIIFISRKVSLLMIVKLNTYFIRWVVQLCLTLCGPMDCSPPGFSVSGTFQARILEGIGHFLLQGIFLTQALNPGIFLSPALEGRFLTTSATYNQEFCGCPLVRLIKWS